MRDEWGRHPIDGIIDRYLSRMPGAWGAYHNDPTYNAQIQFMKSFLILVDMAMEDEGIEIDPRIRILRTAMYGAPDLDESFERMKQYKIKFDELSDEAVNRMLIEGM